MHTRCEAGGIITLKTNALFAGFNVPWYIGARLWQQLQQQTKDFIRTAAAAGLSAVGATALRRRQQAADQLVTIGGHTFTHPILTRVPNDVAQGEITAGREILQDKLQLPVNFFCYPNGRASDFDAAHIKLVQAADFDCAVSTVEDLCNRQGDLFRLPRKNVSGQFTTAALDCKLTGLWWRAG